MHLVARYRWVRMTIRMTCTFCAKEAACQGLSGFP
jgi:hypothetical protein